MVRFLGPFWFNCIVTSQYYLYSIQWKKLLKISWNGSSTYAYANDRKTMIPQKVSMINRTGITLKLPYYCLTCSLSRNKCFYFILHLSSQIRCTLLVLRIININYLVQGHWSSNSVDFRMENSRWLLAFHLSSSTPGVWLTSGLSLSNVYNLYNIIHWYKRSYFTPVGESLVV
jgi:hypothetical protein